MPTNAELQTRIEALEAEIASLRRQKTGSSSQDSARPRSQPVEPEVTISYPRAHIDMPSEDELLPLQKIVLHAYPNLGSDERNPRFASQERNLWHTDFCRALRWLQSAAPQAELNKKCAISWWAGEISPGLSVGAFYAAAIVANDFAFSHPRDGLELAIHRYATRDPLWPASWRKVLQSGELRQPIAKLSAEQRSPYPTPRPTQREFVEGQWRDVEMRKVGGW
jgi:hypothetical protein